MIKKLLCIGLLFSSAATLQGVIAVGDTADAATTFQFQVGSAIYDAEHQRLWTLSGQDLTGFSTDIQAYGISYTTAIPVDGALDVTLRAYPYVSTQALLTSIDNDSNFVISENPVANPLLGKQYSCVTFLGSYITVVNTTTPQYIYLLQSVFFNDGAAAGTTSADGLSLVSVLDLESPNQAKAIAGSGLGVLFFANAQGTFGTATSNISFALSSTTYAVVNGLNTACAAMAKQADQAVTVSTPVLTAGGNDLASIGSSVTLYPSPASTSQMYVGVDVTAGSSGARAVGMFLATSNFATETTSASVSFSSILPNDIGNPNQLTPVSTTTNSRVMVPNITTTMTSTGLSYIITSRYDGASQQSIYAMPMVTQATNGIDNGKIASFDSVVQNFQIIGTSYRTQGFSTLIADATEITITGSTAVQRRLQVGGGPVPLASGTLINQLLALGDAVYISIQAPFATDSTPGMFKSQALFDAQGRIMSWTPWQRVAGTDDQILFAMKNRGTDATMYVSGSTPNTVQQTVWNSTTDVTSFITALNSAMPKGNGGVQGLMAVSNHTTDLSGFPLAIATGNQAVVIAQTGELSSGNIIMSSPQNTITINNDLGLNIGSVVTTTFANDTATSNNWFFMGGDNGLAVLSNNTSGYAFNGELTSLASLTASGMSCKTLGNFKFIKKLASDNNFLYVMTLEGVYRIALVANKFTLTSPAALDAQVVLQATTIDPMASCLDMLVDNNMMILGTTNGLYTLDLSGGLPALPVTVIIPGGLSAVSRLATISNDANSDQRFYTSSNLYVLTLNYALQQARLNRFTVSNGIVTAIEDQLLQGQNGPLLIFDYMTNNIFIDGSLGFATSYRIGSIPPALKYLQYSLQAGKSSTQTLIRAHTSDISIASVVNSLGLTAIARDYASGCLMLAADFGLLTDS